MTANLKKDRPIKEVNPRRRVIKGVIIVLILLIVVWIGSVGILAKLLLNRAERLQQMAANPASVNLADVAVEIHGAHREFSILHAEIAPVLWISFLFKGDVGAVKPLVGAGGELLNAGDVVLGALSPKLADLNVSTLSMKDLPQILDALASAQPEVAQAQNNIDSAAETIARIRRPLSPRLEYWVSLAGKLMPLAQSGIRGVQILPDLMAKDGSRTYLVLLQNSNELRPTGGFISAVARVELNHGQLDPLTVEDSYAIDDFTNYYPDPPRPLLDYMGLEQWVFRDANWSPDFPTSAREAIHLYQISRPGQVDGAIGVTLEGVGMLIAGLGPLDVPDLPEPVTAANFGSIIQETWNPPPGMDSSTVKAWLSSRKQSLGLILKTAMEKLLSGNANWTQLGRGLMDALDQRQLLVYTIPEANELKQLHWDGSLLSSQGDYLMVVDANLGYNKVNPLINEEVNYKATLLPDGTGHAVLELNYIHQGKKKDIVCRQPSFLSAVTYEFLVNTCYYDYLRLILPSGSRLLQATAHPVPGDYFLSGKAADGQAEMSRDDLLNRAVLDQFFVVEYGKQLRTHFEYDLPTVVRDVGGEKQYTLVVQKQPGTDAIPVKVVVTLPPGARLISSNPVPTASSGAGLEYDLRLDVDRQIDVVYTLAP